MKIILAFLERFHDIKNINANPKKSLDRVWFYVYAGGSGSPEGA